MTKTVIDLSPAFARMVSVFAPDGEGDDDPSPAADSDDDVSLPDDAAGEGDEETDDTEPVKNPKQKAASEEAKRYRLKLRQAEARIKELEDGSASDELRAENAELRLRLAFNDACHDYKVTDREAVWRLAGDDLKTIVEDDGTVSSERLEAVVRSVVTRYPHFTEDEAPEPDLPTEPSGRQTNNARKSSSASDLEALRKKFPALRR